MESVKNVRARVGGGGELNLSFLINTFFKEFMSIKKISLLKNKIKFLNE